MKITSPSRLTTCPITNSPFRQKLNQLQKEYNLPDTTPAVLENVRGNQGTLVSDPISSIHLTPSPPQGSCNASFHLFNISLHGENSQGSIVSPLDHQIIESHFQPKILIDNTCTDTQAVVPFLVKVHHRSQRPNSTVSSEYQINNIIYCTTQQQKTKKSRRGKRGGTNYQKRKKERTHA